MVTDSLEQFEAGHLWHTMVTDDQVRRSFAQKFKREQAIFNGMYLYTRRDARERTGEKITDIRLIFD